MVIKFKFYCSLHNLLMLIKKDSKLKHVKTLKLPSPENTNTAMQMTQNPGSTQNNNFCARMNGHKMSLASLTR